jgi:hypothetical protein
MNQTSKSPASEVEDPMVVARKQADDEALWIRADTAPVAYLQQELRRLHRAVEGKAADEGSAAAGKENVDDIRALLEQLDVLPRQGPSRIFAVAAVMRRRVASFYDVIRIDANMHGYGRALEYLRSPEVFEKALEKVFERIGSPMMPWPNDFAKAVIVKAVDLAEARLKELGATNQLEKL